MSNMVCTHANMERLRARGRLGLGPPVRPLRVGLRELLGGAPHVVHVVALVGLDVDAAKGARPAFILDGDDALEALAQRQRKQADAGVKVEREVALLFADRDLYELVHEAHTNGMQPRNFVAPAHILLDEMQDMRDLYWELLDIVFATEGRHPR